MSSKDLTLLVVAGPTAVGKTAAGITLAEHFNTEIISADSRQFYRETRIGTAVPSDEELARVKHHFIQSISVKDPYNASMYEQEVLAKLDELFKKHELVVMVGGSGLYIDAVCEGIDDLPRVDPEIRKTLADRLVHEGLEVLVEELKEVDPLTWERVDRKNHMRVLKALEITEQTGKPYSSFLTAVKQERPFNIVRTALDLPREVLYERINRRVELMMEAGLLDEVKEVYPLRHYTAMKTVGYRELFSVLDGEIPLEEGIDLIKRHTRKFARKQITWYRKENRYLWYHPNNVSDIGALCS